MKERIKYLLLASMVIASPGLMLAGDVNTAPIPTLFNTGVCSNTTSAIPWNQIGAKAGADYKGDGLAVTPTESGAHLHCVFQRLDGEATPEGLWLTSTVTNTVSDRFRVTAMDVGRKAANATFNAPYPESSVPLTGEGEVSVSGQSVRFSRPGLKEEYSVSMDGLRQDFIVERAPASPPGGELVVKLAVSGALVEAAADGARLVLTHSGRKIAYSRLRVTDAKGKELPAKIEVSSVGDSLSVDAKDIKELVVVVNDANAVYPVRIDPTFSDNNWVGLGGLGSAIIGQVDALACDNSGNLYVESTHSTGPDTSAIAEWNGYSWLYIATNFSTIYALVCDSSGNLYAGGKFGVVKFNGTNWTNLGLSEVNALAFDKSGNLYAGGSLMSLGGNYTNTIVKWNGTSWSALGSEIGPFNNPNSHEYSAIYALACDNSGNLYAGGAFLNAGGVSVPNIAKWNGTAWSALGSGIQNEGSIGVYDSNFVVTAISCDNSGNVYAGGDFGTVGGPYSVDKWNGTSWSALGSETGSVFSAFSDVFSLACDNSGNLYVGGVFINMGGVNATNIAMWNGSTWSALGSGITGGDTIGYNDQGAYQYYNNGGATVIALALDGFGRLYAGGNFYTAGTNVAHYVAEALLKGVQITTTSLPNGTNGVAYSQTLAAAGGQTPYSWTNISGALPLGLHLSTNGVISGTPTNNGTFNFTVKVTDATNSTATQPLTVIVFGTPVVTIQPTNSSVTVIAGTNVTLSVSVAGTAPFSYWWQLNGTNLPNGIITTVAGNGTFGYSGDGGAATNAGLYNPWAVQVDNSGNLFIADDSNKRIRKVGTNGIITTVAGNGTYGYSGDGGAATNAGLDLPYDVAVDAFGNLFIAESEVNQRIRKVGTNGIITTVAGNGTASYSGDGGAATNAGLDNPYGVAVDASDNLFIADTENQRIRKVGTNGIITTVAGNGTYIYSGDGGAATNAGLDVPYDVAVDTFGNLFIADTYSQRIRKVGTNGIITTVAGNGTASYSGDGGSATNAGLDGPYGVAVDASDNLLIADTRNGRVRKVVNPSIAVFGPTLVLNDVSLGNAGAYDVVVSNLYGSVTSSVVNVTVTLPVFVSTPQISSGKTNFMFQISGPSGTNVVLQVSTNLFNWSPVSTSSIPVSGTITFTNSISGSNQRFYRIQYQ